MAASTPKPTWLVTGTSNGFGLALAQHILRQNHNLISLSRHVKPHNSLVEITSNGSVPNPPTLHHITHDLSNPDPQVLKTTLQSFLDSHPDVQVDVLVNNAGICAFGPVERIPQSTMERTMTINFYSPLWLIQSLLMQMRRSRNGIPKTIVNISSTQGVSCDASEVAYESSKHALEGMSGVLAQEMTEFGIRVIVVNLGSFRTQFALGDSTATAVYEDPPKPEEVDDDPYADPENGVRKRIDMVSKYANMPKAAKSEPSKGAKVLFDAVAGSEGNEARAVMDGQRQAIRDGYAGGVSAIERLILGSDASAKVEKQLAMLQKQSDSCKTVSGFADADD